MDIQIEVKENDAIIILDSGKAEGMLRYAYLVTVSDPIEFPVKIQKAILTHYRKMGDTERYNRLKQSGFNYLEYIKK